MNQYIVLRDVFMIPLQKQENLVHSCKRRIMDIKIPPLVFDPSWPIIVSETVPGSNTFRLQMSIFLIHLVSIGMHLSAPTAQTTRDRLIALLSQQLTTG